MYFATDDGFAAREDTVRSLGEKGHAIIGINEGDIEWQGAEDSDQLL